MSKRRKYSPEFKREAIELTRMDRVTINQIAKDLGIGANMLSRWRREHEQDKLRHYGARARPGTKRWLCSSGNLRG